MKSITTLRHENDLTSRLALPPSGIQPVDDWMAKLYALWEYRRPGAELPTPDDLGLAGQIAQSRGRIHIVDTVATDPGGYFFKLWGSRASLDRGINYTRLRLGDMPHSTMRDTAIADYATVSATGVPVYQLVYQLHRGTRYAYARLLLPLASDRRAVDQILVCVHERPVPELTPAS